MDNYNKKSKSFEDAVNHTSPYIYTLSYRLTGSSDNAKDLLQETYVKAWRNWENLKNRENPIPWLRKICINTFIDNSRRSGKERKITEVDFPQVEHDIVSAMPTPEEELMIDEEVRIIHSQCYSILTSHLPLYQRIVFALIDIFQLSIDDVADIISRSRSATKALLHRAREKMSNYIGPSCSLLISGNSCKCRSWIAFAQEYQKRREYLKHILSTQKKSDEHGQIIKNRLISLFNKLPIINPPSDWLDDAIESLKK
jgi:RNA polymerase sigma-70 factor (ECF subfamily)